MKGRGIAKPAMRRKIQNVPSVQQLLLFLFSDTDSISFPRCAMFVLGIGVGEIQKRFHDCPVLDEEFIDIPRSSPASLLTSKE